MDIKMLNEPIEVEYRGSKFKFYKLPIAGVYKLLKLYSIAFEKVGLDITSGMKDDIKVEKVMSELFSDETLDLFIELVSIGTRLPIDVVQTLPADVTIFCFNVIIERCIDKDFFSQRVVELMETLIKNLEMATSSQEVFQELQEKQVGN